jgi:Putative phage serine protease XkdF
MYDPDVPGANGSLGPFGELEYCEPHVYARDITSGAGNCVCGASLGDDLHTEAAPGVPVPDGKRMVCKAAGEPQRYCLGIAYQANRNPLIAKGQDGGRDFLTPESLEQAAWEFISNGPRVGMFHLDGTETDGGGDATATVVESYIYRPDQPWDLGGGAVVNKGDWLLGAVLSPVAWDMHQRGLITGWSPQGIAKRRKFTPAGGSQ